MEWRWDGGLVDGRLRKRTNKRGAYVSIPVGGPLRAMLDARHAQREATREAMRAAGKPTELAPTILTNSRGDPWTADGFRTSWHKTVKAAVARAGEEATKAGSKLDPKFIVGRTFNDLRGTAVTRLALAGCNEAEIASITGHSLATVSGLLDAHYLGGRAKLAEQAIGKLSERYGPT